MGIAVFFNAYSAFHSRRSRQDYVPLRESSSRESEKIFNFFCEYKGQSHPLHPFIIERMCQDPQLRELLDKRRKGNQIWAHYSASSREITQLAIFENENLHRLIVVHPIRLSFQHVEPIPVLYDIKLFSEAQSSPLVAIYVEEKSHLQLIHIDYMKLIKKTTQRIEFVCFEGSSIEFSLKVFCLCSQKAFQLQDRFHNLLLALTSAEVIKDPIIRLRSFLELLSYESISLYLQEEILLQTEQLIHKITHCRSMQKKAIHILGSDPIAVYALFLYKLNVLQKEIPNKTVVFIESVLLNKKILDAPYIYQVKKYEKINSSTHFFLIEEINKQCKKFILRVHKRILSKDNEIKEIQHLFEYLNTIKKSHFKIEEIQIEIVSYKAYELPMSQHFKEILSLLSQDCPLPVHIKEITFFVFTHHHFESYYFGLQKDTIKECIHDRHLYPSFKDFLELHRLEHFDLKPDTAYADPFSYLYYLHGKSSHIKSKKDYRLLGISLVFNRTSAIADPLPIENLNVKGSAESLLLAMQKSLGAHPSEKRPVWNRVFFQVLPILTNSENEILTYLEKILESVRELFKNLNLEKMVFKIRLQNSLIAKGYETCLIEVKNFIGILSFQIKREQELHFSDCISLASPIDLREQEARRKGKVWAYHIPGLISYMAKQFIKKDFSGVECTLLDNPTLGFIELELDPDHIVIDPKTNTIDYNQGELIPAVDEKGNPRAVGLNQAGVVIGLKTDNLNIGIPVHRLLIIGDITHSNHGAISAQECARINAAIRYAKRKKLPIDWFPASYGVEIRHEKGVESLDASSSTVREIVQYCHHTGLSINLIIDETNIGAQSYWNALAAILQETNGVLIMTSKGSMALTGHHALVCALYRQVHSEDISVYAKDLYPQGLQSLSGYSSVHGPNSDAMAFAPNLEEACELLIRHYYYYYNQSQGLISKRPTIQHQTNQEDASLENQFILEVGRLLKGLKSNREVILEALRDKGSPKPIRWWQDAKGIQEQTLRKGDLFQEPHTIIQEMQVGGWPTMVVFPPIGPLTPADSEIIARAIQKVNKRLPILILGSLSGFTCDPLSMQNRQLVAGASIAKAIVDHQGPISVVNMGHLVGGTFVIFSKQLNRYLRILAIKDSHVKVVGGVVAAKVVFHSQICRKAEENPDVQYIKNSLSSAMKEVQTDVDQTKIRLIEEKILAFSKQRQSELEESLKVVRRQVIAEIENQEAMSFDQIHNVERALKVGSIDAIAPLKNLRAHIIEFQQETISQFIQG